MFDSVNGLQHQIYNLRQTRELLLPQLLSGIVNVSDAESPDSLSSDLGKQLVPVGETQKRSNTVAISNKESLLSEAAKFF
jgi:hypothetical protein